MSSPIVFVSDPSAEVERIGDTLRVAAQRPNVVLVDVDA